MPKKKETGQSVTELKSQLAKLQDKIETLEHSHNNQDFKIEELYSWEAPERLYIPRSRKWFIYLFSLILIIILVLLFIREFIIIAPIAAIGFVVYILATVPPHVVKHTLTTEGINTAGHSFLWHELYDFWFIEKGKNTLIHIDTNLYFPHRLILLIGEGDKEKIKEIMSQYVAYREIPKTTWLERLTDNLAESFHKIAS